MSTPGPPPPPPPVEPRRSWPIRVLRAVLLGAGTGIAFIIGLSFFVAGSVGPEPEASDVCAQVGPPARSGLRNGVTVEAYCGDIDLRLDIGLGGVDGFEADLRAPDPPADSSHARPGHLIWETDGCTAPILGSGPFDFTLACNRHDFGWRNLKFLHDDDVPVWIVANKDRADAGFFYDMQLRCSSVARVWQFGCDTTARVYYTAVRLNPSGVRGMFGS